MEVCGNRENALFVTSGSLVTSGLLITSDILKVKYITSQLLLLLYLLYHHYSCYNRYFIASTVTTTITTISYRVIIDIDTTTPISAPRHFTFFWVSFQSQMRLKRIPKVVKMIPSLRLTIREISIKHGDSCMVSGNYCMDIEATERDRPWIFQMPEAYESLSTGELISNQGIYIT